MGRREESGFGGALGPRSARQDGGEVAHGPEEGLLQVEHLRLGEQAVQVGRVGLPDAAAFIAGEHVPVNAGAALQLGHGAVEQERAEEAGQKRGGDKISPDWSAILSSQEPGIGLEETPRGLLREIPDA